MIRRLGVLFMAVSLLAGWAGVAAAQNKNWGPNDAYAPGEVLVKFKAGTSPAAAAAAHGAQGGRLLRVLGRIGVHHVETPLPVPAAVQAYRARPDVEYAEPNWLWRAVGDRIEPAVIPNDPRFPELWGLHNTGQTGGTPDADIDAPEAWNIQTGSSQVVVGVIDTGRFDHVDLVGNRWVNPGEIPNNNIDDDGNGFVDDVHGWNFFGDNKILYGSDACDDAHGTHVAGTIGAKGNNNTGVVGVNWNVSIMTLKFLGGAGCFGSTADAVDAVNYAAANGAHMTSNSWGGGGFSQALLDAINNGGILFIAAAGNSGTNNDQFPFWPCNLNTPLMICVASTTHTDAKSGFSNFGATKVHLGAPGSSILSTTPNNTYTHFNGTSMATPHVAGVAALLAAQFPGITAANIKCRILQNVDPIAALQGITVTGGRLNAQKALSNACGTHSIAGDIKVNGVGQAGVRVKLRNLATGERTRTTTDANGRYAFDPVDPGTYKIAMKLNLAAPGTVSGHIEVNGVGEAGKTVKIRGGGTDVTDANGDYSVAGVPAGRRRVLIKDVDVP